MESNFTPQESLLVVDEALRLLDTPETFTQGTWKCPVFVKGEFDHILPKKDEHGRTVYAYCIEGAVNQACINALGEPRAVELGALTEKTGEGWDVPNDVLRSGKATDLLSLNQLAEKLFDAIIVDVEPEYMSDNDDLDRYAQMVNDCGFDREFEGTDEEAAEHAERNRMTAYERVTSLLKRKRDSIRASLNLPTS